jgi:hypothetical protein
MTVKRIVPNIITDQTETAKAFYHDILGTTIVMDMGGIVTFAADNNITPQISFARADRGRRCQISPSKLTIWLKLIKGFCMPVSLSNVVQPKSLGVWSDSISVVLLGDCLIYLLMISNTWQTNMTNVIECLRC